MNNESDRFLKKRLNELSERADNTRRCVCSEFLTLAEQETLSAMRLPCPFALFGGYELAERKFAAFGECIRLPAVWVKISPKNEKFADELSHRDFLGSLMALGMRCEVLGDVVVDRKTGYVFCLETASRHILENLTKVKRTDVVCSELTEEPSFASELPELSGLVVASERLDSIIAAVYKLSRSESQALIEDGRVFVNSRLIKSSSFSPEGGGVVSVRGMGRFIYEGVELETKKGRLRVNVRIYC